MSQPSPCQPQFAAGRPQVVQPPPSSEIVWQPNLQPLSIPTPPPMMPAAMQPMPPRSTSGPQVQYSPRGGMACPAAQMMPTQLLPMPGPSFHAPPPPQLLGR